MQIPYLERCLSVKDTVFMVGLSRSSIYAMLNDEVSDFPRPLKIGCRTYFLQTEIERWIASRPRLVSKPKSASLRRTTQ